MSILLKPGGMARRCIVAVVVMCLLNGCLTGALPGGRSRRPEALNGLIGVRFWANYADNYEAWALDQSLDMDVRVHALLLLPWPRYSTVYRDFALQHDSLDVVRGRHGAAAVARMAREAWTKKDSRANWLTRYLLGPENEHVETMLSELAGQEARHYIALARAGNYQLSTTEIMALAQTDDGATRLYLHRLIGSEGMKELAPFLARQVVGRRPPLDWVRDDGPDPTLDALGGSMRLAGRGGNAGAVGGAVAVGILALSFISMTQSGRTFFGPGDVSPEIAAVYALEQLHDDAPADEAVRYPIFEAAARALAVDDGMDWQLTVAAMRFFDNTNTPLTPPSKRAFDIQAAMLQRHALERARDTGRQGWRQAEAILYFLDMAGASFDRNGVNALAIMAARGFEDEDGLFRTLSDGRNALHSAARLVENTRLDAPGLDEARITQLWTYARERNDIALFVIGLTLAPDRERETELMDYLRRMGAAIAAGERSRPSGWRFECDWLQAMKQYQLYDAMPAVVCLLHSGAIQSSQQAWALLSTRGAESLPYILAELEKPSASWRLPGDVGEALLSYLVTHLTHEQLRELAAQSGALGSFQRRLRDYVEGL